MRAAPLVSVVIPTRDRNVEVQRAISSALCQTMRDLEVIVVDDGSGDPTGVALGAIVTDDRVRFHRNDSPGGPSVARNLGTALARGSFVAYLDSDDEWHRSKLERQVGALRRRDRDGGLSLCGYEVVHGNVRRARVPREVRAGNVVQLLDPRHEPTVTSCFMLPTALARTDGFDATLAAYEDLDLAARIARGHDVVTTPSILVRKYVSSERQFSGPRIIDARRALLAKYEDVLRGHPAVLARNQLTMAAELARIGRADEALALLASIDSNHLSLWVRIARRARPTNAGRLSRMLDALRLAERFSVRGALWHLRTSRLRWQP
jgi:glycosyltransferase involved in cell wall biosynthesis